jgi:hypothetical protein
MQPKIVLPDGFTSALDAEPVGETDVTTRQLACDGMMMDDRDARIFSERSLIAGIREYGCLTDEE